VSGGAKNQQQHRSASMPLLGLSSVKSMVKPLCKHHLKLKQVFDNKWIFLHLLA
jgi:hypothetical protein